MKSVLFVTALSLILLFSCTDTAKKRVLPIIGNYDVEYKTVDGKEITDTVFPKIPEFNYLNQDSIMIHSESMKGKVWIADFFFTSCPTICPKMTTQMKRLSLMTKDLSKEVQFMSFSINPDIDQPTLLRAYIKQYGITAKNWYFFTGDEQETHNLAHDFFNVGAERNADAEGGFGHSDTFVLIDHEGYVRGLYKGTETKEVNRLEKDLRKLLKYEYELDI